MELFELGVRILKNEVKLFWLSWKETMLTLYVKFLGTTTHTGSTNTSIPVNISKEPTYIIPLLSMTGVSSIQLFVI